MTGIFCSSVINGVSARVSESGQNGIINRVKGGVDRNKIDR